MRSALVLAVLLAAAPARADDHDTWADVLDPHGDEVRQILEKAGQAQMQAANFVNYDGGDPTGEVRTKLLDDAFGMLRYARKLSPHNADVLFLLGKVADDGGRAAAAIEALEAYVKDAQTAAPEAHQRLGRLYLRVHKLDPAIRHLRIAMAGGGGAATTIYLASALTASGRGDDAIQLLADAVDDQHGQYWNVDATTLGLALAVAYDRDEQLSDAFQTIDHMQSALSSSYPQQLQQSIASIQFVPAIDQHYYQALFYETAGFYAEARAEWLNYAAGGPDAHWKDRALAHVVAIDKLRADDLAARAKGKGKPVEPQPPPSQGSYPIP